MINNKFSTLSSFLLSYDNKNLINSLINYNDIDSNKYQWHKTNVTFLTSCASGSDFNFNMIHFINSPKNKLS